MQTQEQKREYQRTWRRQWRLKNPERARAKYNRWRQKNLTYCYQRHKEWVQKNPVRALLFGCKRHAKKLGIEFSLKLEDIVIPAVCPVLGIPLSFAGGFEARYNSPSIDRFDNALGYTKENVRVISFRANHLKSDATVEEVEKILRYMKDQL